MEYSNCLHSGSAARRQAADIAKINMIKALERGLDLDEVVLADDASTALMDNIGQLQQSNASACSARGERRSSESSLPPLAGRLAGARDLQGGGGSR
jgi:hypothetical protein